jgi:hypothetical protein
MRCSRTTGKSSFQCRPPSTTNAHWRRCEEYLFHSVTTAFETCCHCALIGDPLTLVSGSNICVSLRGLLPPLVATAKSASKSAHRRSGGGAFAGVTGNRTTDGSKSCTTTCTLQDMRLRRLIGLSTSGDRRSRLRIGRIEAGLLDCPCVALVLILILLRLALSLRRINVHILRSRRSRRKYNWQ